MPVSTSSLPILNFPIDCLMATSESEISVVSLSEVAIKQSIGKLRIGKDEVLTGIADLRLRVLPYTANHALHLFDLPAHHGDPFDRQIIAQALCEKIAVLTSDQKFSLYKGLRIVW